MQAAQNFYNKGVVAKAEGNFEASAAFYIRALEIDKDWDFPEAWHNTAAALLYIQDEQKAIPYLQKAIELYQLRIEYGEQLAYYYYWLAAAYALGKQKEAALIALKESIRRTSTYAEMAIEEEDFKVYWEDVQFLALVEPTLSRLKMIRFKGKALLYTDLKLVEKEWLTTFVNTTRKESWELSTYLQKDNTQAMAPQAEAIYKNTNYFKIVTALYVDTGLLNLILINQYYSQDVKSILCYLKQADNNTTLAEILGVFELKLGQLDGQNWVELIEELKLYCTKIVYEMPNGEKYRLPILNI